MDKMEEQPLEYVYLKSNPNEWEIGNPANVQISLKALKAYQEGDLEECLKYFADTVEIAFDNYEAKLSNADLKVFFTKGRQSAKKIEIQMNDWETVTAKNKSEEWVSLWYKEIVHNNDGKIDSVSVMDDIKIENGKIAVLDQKIRHFAKK
ncbi:hypothetical protein BH23BAC1_BH23BAC1_47580 [soil metagenome]